LIAVLTAAGVWWYVNGDDFDLGPRARIGEPAPPIVGTTLDGAPLDLATYRGRPVIVNFWGPSCVPCRDEFPQFLQKLEEHAGDRLAVVGVLTDDPVEPARRFAAEYRASWPTVVDPDQAIKRTYRVVARPHSWFIDADGVIRSMQIGGPMSDADFERQYARIAP
jgi:cytochrome c biogenesis protein CcmG, thiol:disulfide interchange protein DsbE